jgi:hypothetical protein
MTGIAQKLYIRGAITRNGRSIEEFRRPCV